MTFETAFTQFVGSRVSIQQMPIATSAPLISSSRTRAVSGCSAAKATPQHARDDTAALAFTGEAVA